MTSTTYHKNILRTSILSTTLDRRECDLLVIWDKLNESMEQPKLVELIGQATNWERVQFVREDDVLRGTYFHLLLKNMPVGIKLRMKFRIDGLHTVDDRYEVEPDDGFGDKNNLFYINPKMFKGRNIVFPIVIPFVGWALEAEQREQRGLSEKLESAALPQDMITTTRLYHSFIYMKKQKERHPEMTWEEIKLKAKRAKVSKQRSRKMSKMESSVMKSTSSSSEFSARHFGGAARSSASDLGVASSASLRSATQSSGGSRISGSRSSNKKCRNISSSPSRHPRSKNKSSIINNSNNSNTFSTSFSALGMKKRVKKRRPPPTQAGTLTYCQGLSIYELENRMTAIVKESRMVAEHGESRRNSRSK